MNRQHPNYNHSKWKTAVHLGIASFWVFMKPLWHCRLIAAGATSRGTACQRDGRGRLGLHLGRPLVAVHLRNGDLAQDAGCQPDITSLRDVGGGAVAVSLPEDLPLPLVPRHVDALRAAAGGARLPRAPVGEAHGSPVLGSPMINLNQD